MEFRDIKEDFSNKDEEIKYLITPVGNRKEMPLVFKFRNNENNINFFKAVFFHIKEEGMDIVEILNSRNKYGKTFLHYAAEYGDLDIFMLLLDNGASLSIKDKKEKTPIDCAKDYNRTEILNYISEHYKEVLTEFNKKFFDHTLKKSTDSVIPASRNNPIKERDCFGKTELHRASENGDSDRVEYLLECGADPNIQDCFGKTALHYASENRNSDCLRHLLEFGADPNIQDETGRTAIHYSIGKIENIKLLLIYEANPNIQDKKKQTPSHLAAFNSDIDSLMVLIDSGGNLNIKDNKEKSVLSIALKKFCKKKQIVESLKSISKQQKRMDSDIFLEI